MTTQEKQIIILEVVNLFFFLFILLPTIHHVSILANTLNKPALDPAPKSSALPNGLYIQGKGFWGLSGEFLGKKLAKCQFVKKINKAKRHKQIYCRPGSSSSVTMNCHY